MVEEVLPFVTPIASMGIAGIWIIYFIYKEKAYYKMIKEALDNNTEAIHQLQRWVEYMSNKETHNG